MVDSRRWTSVVEQGPQRTDDDRARAGARVAGDAPELVDELEARGRVDGVEQLGALAAAVGVELRRELGGRLLPEEAAPDRERLGDARRPRLDAASGGRHDRDLVVDPHPLVGERADTSVEAAGGAGGREELARPADLARHRLGREGVEVVEVAEDGALRDAGPCRDARRARLRLALVEELQQRGDDQLATLLGPEPAPVDRLAVGVAGGHAGGRGHGATLSNDSQTVKTLRGRRRRAPAGRSPPPRRRG